ncbi:hypothetical protein DOM21_09715 [Bacteriovorax stolpii]|uniref:Uncharacterized protein n=1 Tax=Bacteriovorax stolpii TaxID=960 RepID=A0A2K9NRZ6_BACTC|nr:hypothetical protein [Bacteriovorax stolpii]AUN98296.1 hypothetical protein C0V70_09305 [Bacteriovorax stolpii]QDK41724.1 hypothetical protein DOM21_09715 [Bacteriovorax stolpii]TDP52221.1 hypothetical protein C8D79_2871 [Bacteriovorax stolpii]
MKHTLLVLLVAMPMTVFANTISFRCKSADIQGVHKFDASGVVTVDDFNRVEGIANIVTEKAGATQSIQSFEEVRVEGYIRHFNGGEVSKEPFDQLVLKTNEPYLKNLNLLLDFEEKIASRISTIDNFSYRSNCKTVDTFR